MPAIWINNPFDNLPEEGAKPQRYSSLAAALAARGADVTWWTSAFSHARKAVRAGADGRPLPAAFRRPDGVDMRLLRVPGYGSNVGLARIRNHRAFAHCWLEEAVAAVEGGALAAPDVLVVSTPPLATFRAAAALRERFGCRIVLDIMDAWPDAFEGLVPGPRWLRRAVVSTLLRGARKAADEAFQCADALSGTSEGYLALARSRGAKCTMAAFSHACERLFDFAPRAGRPSAESPLRLVYAGNMGPLYDLSTLVAAVASLAAGGFPVRLDLAGSGPDEPRLRRQAKGCPAIAFHGFLDEGRFHALLSGAEVGVIPLVSESAVAIPYKLPDYASHGLAVLGCLGGESGRLVASREAGLSYRPHDGEGLKKVIRSLAEDPAGLAAMRGNSLRMAKDNFLASNIYRRFSDFVLGWTGDIPSASPAKI